MALARSLFLGDDITPGRLVLMVLFAVAVGVPLGVQAGELYVQHNAPEAATPEENEPTTPVHRRPADGALATSRTPTFVWSEVQDESRVTYSLQYSPDPTFEHGPQVVVFGLDEPRHTVDDEHRLPPGSTIHWRVYAIDRWSNPSGWSEPSAFTTGP